MTRLQAENSSTDTTSGSSSDSSSSGTTSSSSGSGSSSSDSESSTSEESSKPQPSADPTTVSTEPSKRSTPRRSTDSVKGSNNNLPKPETDKCSSPKKVTAEKSIKPEEKTKKAKNSSSQSSHSEEDSPSKPTPAKTLPPRRRTSVPSKPKNNATVTPRHGKTSTRTSTSTKGGKNQGGSSSPSAVSTRNSTTSAAKTESKKPIKKKSIFSPDNSSESDHDDNKSAPKPVPKTMTRTNTNPTNTRPKGRPRKVSTEKNKANGTQPEKAKDISVPAKESTTEKPKRRNSAKSAGPPPKIKPDNKDKSKYRSKPYITSCSSTDSETGISVSSESDSNASNTGSTKNVDRQDSSEIKTGKTKPPSKTNKSEVDSAINIVDSEDNNDKQTVPRKSTRSLSARKSNLISRKPDVSSIVTSGHNTDTESESEMGNGKRSNSTSPVKKGSVSSKGPPVRRAVPPALPRSPLAPPPAPEDRTCPVIGCDSLGHLSGKLERHFTIEACPAYHNLTADQCVAAATERAVAHEARRRAAAVCAQRRSQQPSLEQRAYQLKVKDFRSKWKGPPDSKDKLALATVSESEEKMSEREPVLDGFVPDYDLQLFREAQANAAFKIEEELKVLPASRGTRYVVMGKYCMEVWYQSPYPPDAARLPKLYLCEFCLNHHKTVAGIERHRAKCVWRHPPGDEVYRKGKLGVWQVDGRKHKQYCQQLCLLAKFFLDHKTLYYDVEPFLFYVMTLADSEGCHTVGYFSKEKNSFLNYNVSCILTLPPYQRQGYGRLLIDFSYLLTRTEGKTGSPEKPLSDLGLISYRSYWKDVLLRKLCAAPGPTLSVRDLSQELAVNSYDIVSTLQALGIMKYWKGKHIILKRQDVLEEYAERARRRDSSRQVDPACLRWTPFAAAPPPPR